MNTYNKILFFCFFTLTCSTSNEIKLFTTTSTEFKENYSSLFIKFSNFEELKTKIKVDLQLVEYIADDNYKFGSKYTFSDSIENDFINIEIPQGRYVGTIELISSKTIPFYKKINGHHTIYFGKNQYDNKIDLKTDKCYINKFYSQSLIDSSRNGLFCNDLLVTDKTKSIKVNATKETNFNVTKTLFFNYIGVRSGFLDAFAYYSYAPFLLISGIFGFIQYDFDISAEMYE